MCPNWYCFIQSFHRSIISILVGIIFWFPSQGVQQIRFLQRRMSDALPSKIACSLLRSSSIETEKPIEGDYTVSNKATSIATETGPFIWQDGVLATMLQFLNHNSVCALEVVNKDLRHTLRAQWVWKLLCHRDFPGTKYGIPGGKESPLHWKKVYSEATSATHQWQTYHTNRNKVASVLTSPVTCSSQDQSMESPGNTLTPSLCADPATRDRCSCVSSWRRNPCYWSSKGTHTPDTSDWLQYSTASQVCMISAVEICAYHAFWQPYMIRDVNSRTTPVYTPKKVQLWSVFRPSDKWDIPMEDVLVGEWDIPEEQPAKPFVFELPHPVLVCGGALRFDLVGKYQRQTVLFDDDYYVCINYIRVMGIPLPGLQCTEVIKDEEEEEGGREKVYYRLEIASDMNLTMDEVIRSQQRNDRSNIMLRFF